MMLKLSLVVAVTLPLFACTTHDRRFYNNEPVKGSGLSQPGPLDMVPPPADQPPGSALPPAPQPPSADSSAVELPSS